MKTSTTIKQRVSDPLITDFDTCVIRSQLRTNRINPLIPSHNSLQIRDYPLKST